MLKDIIGLTNEPIQVSAYTLMLQIFLHFFCKVYAKFRAK